jgi:hypothetical protein
MWEDNNLYEIIGCFCGEGGVGGKEDEEEEKILLNSLKYNTSYNGLSAVLLCTWNKELLIT